MPRSSRQIAIIGGGVAGTTLALFLKNRNPDYGVAIFDSSKSVASRILVSGNGRCNFYNGFYLDESNNNDSLLSEVRPIIDNGIGHKAFEEFVTMLNFPYYDKDGLYYPFSNKSSSIHDSMLMKLDEFGIEAIHESVVSIDDVSDESILFSTIDDEGRRKSYNYPKIAISMGGNSLNYRPFDWHMLDKIGVSHKEYTPCLCPLKVKETGLKALDGVRCKCVMSLSKSSKEIYKEEGEVLFKNDGLSGICIFNASAHIEPKEIESYTISLNLLTHSNRTIAIDGGNIDFSLPYELAQYVKMRARIDGLSLNEEARSLTFKVSAFYPFKNSQVSRGGIDMNEVDTSSMALKKHGNVLVLGEMLDITLPCGGYNIGLCIIEAYKAMVGLLDRESR